MSRINPTSRLIFALLILLISGCSQEALLEKFIPKEESALAKELIAKLAIKDFTAVESRLDAKLRTPDIREKLNQMQQVLPPGEPKSVRTVGSQTHQFDAVTTYKLTYEYEYPDGWVLASTVLERRDGQITLQGIHFLPAKQSLAVTNRFTFEGKGRAHYIVFALAIVIPLFVIYALVLCARTNIHKRKWLWFLFIAVGLIQFQFEWTSGAWSIQPISFTLLSAAFVKAGPMAPYIFTLPLPLGAILFLVKKMRSDPH
jgi:uncharacterized membrane protein YfbV (UPF0208 family)